MKCEKACEVCSKVRDRKELVIPVYPTVLSVLSKSSCLESKDFLVDPDLPLVNFTAA